jgi:hypothetical protein
MKTVDTCWVYLAGAAADTRDALRYLIPRLDVAIAATPTPLLVELRALCVRHACALKNALKHPGGNVRKRATDRR